MRLIMVAFLAATPVSAEEITVTMAGSQYSPSTISASIGDTLRFVNDGDIDHNVFVPTAGFAIDLGKQEPGSELTYSVGKAGAFDLECVFHEHMTARVEVSR